MGAVLAARRVLLKDPGVLLKDPGVFLKDPGVLLKDPGVSHISSTMKNMGAHLGSLYVIF